MASPSGSYRPLRAAKSVYYEVRVRGLPGETTLGEFPGLRAKAEGAETVLAGELPDQAALFGARPSRSARPRAARSPSEGGMAMMRIPGWLTEAARPARGPVPWAGMGLGALAVGVPLAVGMGAGQPVKGGVMGFGGLARASGGGVGPRPVGMRRGAFAGIFGAGGLLIGAALNGRGWLAVAVLVVVAGVSALLSSIGATWSTAGMFLLVYAALGTGPIGALRPLWLTLAWVLAGVGWTLVLMVPGWLRHPRAVEENRVAAA